jgi:hypothetical protein
MLVRLMSHVRLSMDAPAPTNSSLTTLLTAPLSSMSAMPETSTVTVVGLACAMPTCAAAQASVALAKARAKVAPVFICHFPQSVEQWRSST